MPAYSPAAIRTDYDLRGMVNVRVSAQNSRPATCMTATPGRQTRHEDEENHMHDQSTGFTMVLGGVDRSADYRRQLRAGKRFTLALMIMVAVLMASTGWLAGVALTPQVAAATPAAGTAASATDPYPAIY